MRRDGAMSIWHEAYDISKSARKEIEETMIARNVVSVDVLRKERVKE